ncbi:hypothetical protein [Desulfonatronospira sp.]|nr:hypothetical protein [Desulfonatronospira sp.]
MERMQDRLGVKARHRLIDKESNAVYALQESPADYRPGFDGKMFT